MKERREFPRVSASCEITWKTIDERSVPQRGAPPAATGFLQNISGGGLCFSSETPPPVGVMLALKMKLPDVPTPVIALGRAQWVEESPAGYEVGVEFWWVGWQDEGAQAEIRNLITHKLAEPSPSPH
jgi:PilZ domain